MIDFPTRLENTLGIFYSSRPTIINRCLHLPGFSYHDMVLVDTGFIPKRQKPVRSRIYLWIRADKAAMKRELDEFSNNFTCSYDLATLWAPFKQKHTGTINAFVPSKMTLTQFNQHWCYRHVKHQARQKKRAYKDLQRAYLTACRDVRNSYVRDMVSDTGFNSKKLY